MKKGDLYNSEKDFLLLNDRAYSNPKKEISYINLIRLYSVKKDEKKSIKFLKKLKKIGFSDFSIFENDTDFDFLINLEDYEKIKNK